MTRGGVALACLVLAACGGRSSSAPSRDDAGVAKDAAVVDLAPRPLGMPDLASFGWRKRGGHPAFRIARKGETDGKWDVVVTTCKQALAADPGHLEAAWLLAIGLAKLGKHDELVAPLQLAAAGDFGKWGHASLEQPSLEPFLATPLGQAWRRRVEQDRAAYVASLARSVVINAGGDLYTYDPEGPRWNRLTRTYGAVIGGMRVPSANKIVYVTRQRAATKTEATLAIGIIDLARGKTLNPTELGTKGPIAVAYSTKGDAGVWIGTGTPRITSWRLLEDNGKLSARPPKSARPAGAWLEVTNRTARPRTIPVFDITADFDDKGLASAIRIGMSNRVLSVPSPGLIDGNSATWSPDRRRLAFVAQLDDQCTKGAVNAAAFVADAATGALHELERAAGGLTIDWLTDRKPVVAGDKGVSIIDLDGGKAIHLDGADGLITPRVRPKCTPADDDVPLPVDPDIQESASVQPPDAGVAAPRQKW